MTTDHQEQTHDELHRWTAEQLEVGPQATLEEVERAFVRRLDDAELVPLEQSHFAWHILTHAAEQVNDYGAASAAWPGPIQTFQSDVEPALREETEGLARQYFEIECSERRQRWQALQRRCTCFPSLQHRLSQLEQGLDLAREEIESLKGEYFALAEDILQLYPLPPVERAIERRSFLVAKGRDQRCVAAAWRFVDAYPQLTALAPEYVKSLAAWEQRRKQLDKARRAAQKTSKRVVVQPASAGASAGDSRFPYWVIWLGIVALSSVLRSINNHPAPQGYVAPQPNWNQPKVAPLDQETIRQLLKSPPSPENEALRRLLGVPKEADEKPPDEGP